MARFLEIICTQPLFGSEIVYAYLDEIDPVKLKSACGKLTKFNLRQIKEKQIAGSSCKMQIYTPDIPEDQRQTFLASLGIQNQEELKRVYINHFKDKHPSMAGLCDSLMSEENMNPWKPYLMSDIFPLGIQVLGFRSDDRTFEYRF